MNGRIVALFEREGADAWYTHDAKELIPEGASCAKCGASEFAKEMDIVDVWFESGCSWRAVLAPDQRPADLYLEGNDQFRGWYMSSLMNSVALRHAAPYRMTLTPGWTLDEQGKALSKSRGHRYPADRGRRASWARRSFGCGSLRSITARMSSPAFRC